MEHDTDHPDARPADAGREPPLLSVVMATYNRADFIAAALESILGQDYSPLEIIVVDDGSTDGTADLVQTLAQDAPAPIRYVRQANRGLPATHNHGLRLARGAVISFLDSDDLWPAGRLPDRLDDLAGSPAEAGSRPGIILGQAHRFADGATVDARELAAANDRPFHYTLGAALIARWVFDAVGPFDESLRQCADWDWFARAREAGIPMRADPRVTLRVRVHGGNMTRDRAEGGQFTARMIRKHLERTRGRQAADGGDEP